MAILAAHGVEMDLPDGWDGRIGRREQAPAPGGLGAAGAASALRPPVTAHAATFPIPAGIGDFGGGGVDVMGGADLLVALVEYDADSLGTALFRREGLPTRLRVGDFDPQGLQRTLPGQAGAQVFFTAADRPFCLYVVLGSFQRRVGTVPLVNDVLAGIRIT